MEANAPNGATMEKPNGEMMATAFGNVHGASGSNDVAMVEMDVDFAPRSSYPSPEQPISLFSLSL